MDLYVDLYIVRKGVDPELIHEKLGNKELIEINAAEGGTDTVNTPGVLKGRPSLTPEQVKEFAIQVLFIEKYFGKPQDIEWAIDKSGKVRILQSRQLRTGEIKKDSIAGVPSVKPKAVLMKGKGIVVQKGVGAGRVFIVNNGEELGHFPKGAVLVARLANMKRDEMEDILDRLGRLIAYIRKLDALLRDDSAIERYTKRFVEGNYDLK